MNNAKEKIALVTGATGFVGSHLVRRLIKDLWNVHIIIRPQSNLKLIQDVLNKLTIYTFDGTTDCMFKITATSKPNIVFHLASLFIVEHQPKDLESLIRSNILFGIQLVEAMTKNKLYNLINTGTYWQHYNNEDYNPVNLYAATKQAFEVILRYYLETTPLKVITLKLFDTFGPNDPRPKLFNLLKKAAKEGSTLIMSPGEQLIDIVYIDDVIEAYIIAANRLLNNKVDKYEEYSVSSGNPIKLKDLVEIYQQVIGRRLSIKWGGRPYRSREVMVPWNRGKVLKEWKPKVSLVEGIKKIEDVFNE